MPVINKSKEPIIVEYDPRMDNEEEKKVSESFIDIEDESNLVDIHLKSTMTQKALPPAEPAPQKGMFRSMVDEIKSAAKEMLSD